MTTDAKDSYERYTPEHVMEVVRSMFDGDDWLDPCTTDTNHTRANAYCTASGSFSAYIDSSLMELFPASRMAHDDGLTVGWDNISSQVWVNPPYSRGQLKKWLAKCAESASLGVEVIALIPSDLGSAAGQLAVDTCQAICFVKGRLAFGSPSGQIETGAKQPSVIVYWGEREGRFRREFSKLGKVWVKS